jgi:hypothetical protein
MHMQMYLIQSKKMMSEESDAQPTLEAEATPIEQSRRLHHSEGDGR